MARYSSIIVVALIIRVSISCAFIILGLLDHDTVVGFYGNILNAIEPSLRKKAFNVLDRWFLVLLIAVSPETLDLLRFITPFTSLCLVSSFITNVVPLVTMTQFALCCVSVSASYECLKRDILRSYPRTAAYTLRRLRLSHLEVVERVRLIGQQLGGRIFLYILVLQLVLLEKADKLITKVTTNEFDLEIFTVSVAFLGHLINLWYFSYCPWKAAKKVKYKRVKFCMYLDYELRSCRIIVDTASTNIPHISSNNLSAWFDFIGQTVLQHGEALAALLNLSTVEMDAKAVEEMALLAEELHGRPTVFSAAGCFYLDFHIFYSVIGIVFSYVMIVGPLAFKKLADPLPK